MTEVRYPGRAALAKVVPHAVVEFLDDLWRRTGGANDLVQEGLSSPDEDPGLQAQLARLKAAVEELKAERIDSFRTVMRDELESETIRTIVREEIENETLRVLVREEVEEAALGGPLAAVRSELADLASDMPLPVDASARRRLAALEGNYVKGPAASTDEALARWDGTTGRLLQDGAVKVTDAGEMTNASQPAFLAVNGTQDNNVTGNGTNYTLLPDTEVFDQGNDYNAATGTFTAPVTGRYMLGMQCRLSGLAGATSIIYFIVTSNRNYFATWDAGFTGTFSNGLTVLADMDSGDTAIFRVQAAGIGADTADVVGSNYTYVWGYLAC